MKRRKTIGWLEVILGIGMVALGVYSLSKPNVALGGAVIAFGVLAIITGIAGIVFYIQLEKRTGFGPAFSMVSGILSILAGILILMNINAGTWAFTILFPIWFFAQCISNLSNLTFTRIFYGKGMYWLSMITGILGLFLSFVLLFNPFASFTLAGTYIAVYILLLGVTGIARGCRLISSQQ